MFLGKYKMMLGSDCKLIYGSKDYYRKRLKVLEMERYIRRVNKLYIKLDDKGTKMVKDFGYDYSFNCRKKSYIDRLNEIAKIAALGINSDIEFTASWDLKDYTIYTQKSRKYIGELKYRGREILVYYISRDKQIAYIMQTINDIQKIIRHKDVIIFIEDMDIISENNKFVFGLDSTIVIKPTKYNLNMIRKFEDLDYYCIVQSIYPNEDILLSNWKQAEYMLENKNYVVVMPFIDMEKLHRINVLFKNNQNTDIKIDLITLKENKEKISEILTNNVNIVEIEKGLGGDYRN